MGMEFVTSLPDTHLFENLWLTIARWNLLLDMKLQVKNNDKKYTFKMLCIEFKEEYSESIYIPEHFENDSTSNVEYEQWKLKSDYYCGIESLSDLMNDRTKKSAISAMARNNNISFTVIISEIQQWLEKYNDTIPPKTIEKLRLVNHVTIHSSCKHQIDAGIEMLKKMTESDVLCEQRLNLLI